MLLSPLSNQAVLEQQWIQKKPYVTQPFGARPEYYAKYKQKGHNGCDLRCKAGTQLFAPMDGFARMFDNGNKGYGLHIIIRNPLKKLEVTLAHLQASGINDYQYVSMGDFIGFSGNSGDSSADHLHVTVKPLEEEAGDVWEWKFSKPNNGYGGAIDPLKFFVCWKGSLTEANL